MKRTLTLTLAVFLIAATASAAELAGTWSAQIDDEKPGKLYVNMSREKVFNNFGSTFAISSFTGLTTAQINAATQTPVQFELRREAGTLSYEGVFRNGKGAGHFTFAANRGYIDTIRSMGMEVKLKHGKKTVEEELFMLAALDVSTDFIRSMKAEGYDVSFDKYVEMRLFNVTPEYIREMESLGFKELSAQKLIEARIHGVTPDYIRKMRAAGWDFPLNKYVETRIHGATPEYAEEMRKAGYGNLSHSKLMQFRIHGVTPDFIADLAKAGYKNLDADDLVSMRIHGVTLEFIRELEAAGYRNVPVKKLVAMRIHGIDAKFIKKMNDVD